MRLHDSRETLHRVMKHLKAVRRSWIRTARGASNPEEMREVARVVRRWMRPVRRALRKLEQLRASSSARAPSRHP